MVGRSAKRTGRYSAQIVSPVTLRSVGPILLAILLLLLCQPPADADEAAGYWSPDFGPGDGTNNVVEALAVYQGTLAVGGWFTLAGTVFAPYVALWDGMAFTGTRSAQGLTAAPGA